MSLLPAMLDTLTLRSTGEDIFEADCLDIGSPNVYGGQVLAQSLMAASLSAPDERVLHSMHSYFLRRGDNDYPITYRVERLRDGRSFSTRRVQAYQGDRIIYLMAASFQIREEGLAHQSTMPNVAQPESLTAFSEIFAQFAERFDIKPKGIFSSDSPIIFHPVEHYDPFKPGKRPAKSHVWFKSNGDLSGDQALHKAVVAYASDFNLLITALLPHDVSLFTTPMQMASLDHSMWFHREVRADEWMLFVVESPNAGAARGFCTGRIYSRTGQLLASVTQEGLIRLPAK